MKPILYTALLLVVPAISFAQPTITKMENHTIGTVVKQARDSTHFPAPGSAGASQTWNFTTLVPQDTLTERIVAPSSTMFGTNFPYASYARIADGGRYTYIQKTPTENYMVGAVDSGSGTTVKYYDKTVFSQTPMTYSKSVNDVYTCLSSMSADTSKGTTQMVADGWGTLVLPNGTFTNTIRVKMQIHQVDSIQVGSNKMPGILDATTYMWYDDQHHSPLMRWDSTHYDYTLGQINVTNVTYLLSETYPVSVKDVPKERRYIATLVNNRLFVCGKFDIGRKYNVSLFSLNGQMIQSAQLEGDGQLQMPMNNDLPVGMYVVTLQGPDGNLDRIRAVRQ